MFKQYLLEIEHLHTLADKGQMYIDKLFNEDICINVKVDQSALVVRKDGGQLSYFGREGREQINKIKRAGMDLYEQAIAHIEKQDWKSLPDGLEIHLENFNRSLKTIVRYEEIPQSNLIVSYCKMDGKLIRPDHEFNKHVAEVLQIAPPPVLFSGHLSTVQKAQITQFISASEQERKEQYGSTKFLSFILKLFLHPAQLQWMLTAKTATGSPGYEGLVFYFGNDQPVLAKMIDPMFTAAIIDKKQQSSQDPFNKALTDSVFDMLDTTLEPALQSFKPSPSNSETKYIEFIAYLTKIIAEKNGRELDQLFAEHRQSVDQQRFTRINFKLIPPYVQQLVNKYWWAEDLFRVLLFMLQKEKARINLQSGITQDRKLAVNKAVGTLRTKGLVK